MSSRYEISTAWLISSRKRISGGEEYTLAKARKWRNSVIWQNNGQCHSVQPSAAVAKAAKRSWRGGWRCEGCGLAIGITAAAAVRLSAGCNHIGIRRKARRRRRHRSGETSASLAANGGWRGGWLAHLWRPSASQPGLWRQRPSLSAALYRLAIYLA